MQQALDNLEVVYTYHVHEGASDMGTGCYTTPVYGYNYQSCYHICHYSSGEVCHIHPVGSIPNCGFDGGVFNGYQYSNGYTHNVAVSSYINYYTLGCGKDGNTIESATIIF